MLKFLYVLIFALVSFFLLPSFGYVEKGIFFVAMSAVFILIDLLVVSKIAYFKALTFFVSFAFMIFSFFIITLILGMEFSLEISPEYSNAILICVSLSALYYALRYSATAAYFRKKLIDSPDTKNGYVVDTSAIIDGRLIDICEAGFISSQMIIPEFVVRELQLISDSSNHEKRKKGRRGLDLLKKMKQSDSLSITILNIDYDFLKGVDNKLLHFAKETNARLITTDFNLIKVAEVEGVAVLNINKIATILKPAYTIGEKLKVNIVKKGNSKRQGVGYLEDDTMVVIEDGERFIAQTKTVTVTSFVQSHSGKMLFCRLV